jgi:pimeloyl-ACP methyl ester carboxylesterase
VLSPKSIQTPARITNGPTVVGGIRLLVTDDGNLQAPLTLVLIHGWGSNSTTWSAHLPALVQLGRVLSIDLRGHGGSDTGKRGDATIRQLAEDVAGIIERAGASPAVVVGHSMGGNVVSRLAIEHPRLVRAVVVLDPAYGADDAELLTVPGRVLKHHTWGAFAPGEDVGGFSSTAPRAMLNDARHNLLATPGWILGDLVESLYVGPDAFGHETQAREYLRLRAQPTLALYPSDARAATERSLEASSTTIMIAPIESHFLHQERPEWFVDAVATWLATLTS